MGLVCFEKRINLSCLFSIFALYSPFVLFSLFGKGKQCMERSSSDRQRQDPHRQARFRPTRTDSTRALAPSPASGSQPTAQGSKLLDQARAAIRLRHYSLRTEDTYVHWMKRFIVFHGKRHPAEMGEKEIEHFLSALAVDQRVSAATQNQALNAILFLYRHVLALKPGWIENVVRAKRSQRLPVVLRKHEVKALLDALEGVHWLVGHLLYGA